MLKAGGSEKWGNAMHMGRDMLVGKVGKLPFAVRLRTSCNQMLRALVLTQTFCPCVGQLLRLFVSDCKRYRSESGLR
jgi:hypothetical protein